VTVNLRAVVAVDGQTAWASGTGGAWLRTADAGSTWISGTVPGAEQLDSARSRRSTLPERWF
jgi:photosystem II stability/assembly factor-like uncharacterized protein